MFLVLLLIIIKSLSGVYVAELQESPLCLVIHDNKQLIIGKMYFDLDKSYTFYVEPTSDSFILEHNNYALFFENGKFNLKDENQDVIEFERISNSTDFSLNKIFDRDDFRDKIVGEWIMVNKLYDGKSSQDEAIDKKYVFKYLSDGTLLYDMRFWQKTARELNIKLNLSELPYTKWTIVGDKLFTETGSHITSTSRVIESKIIFDGDTMTKVSDKTTWVFVKIK